MIACLFTSGYLALEWGSRVHELGALGITLWNPVKALTLGLLLVEGVAYAALLFVASVLADVLVYGAAKTAYASIASSAAAALGYAGLTVGLQKLGFSISRPDLRNVIVLLVVVPAGTFAIAVAYCTCLALTGDLPKDAYWEAIERLWVGDTVGIVILLPVAMAIGAGIRKRLSLPVLLVEVAVFVAGTFMALRLIFHSENAFVFFYLLFLPVIWIAMREGFRGAAVALCSMHLMLLGFISFGDYPATTFMAFQLVVLTLASTGLLLGSVVDERRRSDERLREQHAEVTRMARHATAGAMGLALAHQISQPLSTVGSYIHVGRHLLSAKPAEPKPAIEMLDRAASELGVARNILERLRDFVSRGTVRQASVDAVALVRKVIALATDDARAHGVVVHLDAAPPALPIFADALQLEQALINIINNAIEAVAEERETATDGVVVVRLVRAPSGTQIEIEDNGPGVANDITEYLFEPFVTTKPRGMGLGLALSRELIAAQGGTIRWQAAAPRGARFIVTIPTRPEQTGAD